MENERLREVPRVEWSKASGAGGWRVGRVVKEDES
jgi:hypothetical protein